MEKCMQEKDVLEFFVITHSSLNTLLSKQYFLPLSDYMIKRGCSYLIFPKGFCRLYQYFTKPKPFNEWLKRMLLLEMTYEEISERTGLCRGWIAGLIEHKFKHRMPSHIYTSYNVDSILRPDRYATRAHAIDNAKNDVKHVLELYGTNRKGYVVFRSNYF